MDRQIGLLLGPITAQRTQQNAGDPMFADSQPTQRDEFWEVDLASYLLLDPTGTGTTANLPLSGIFVCPPNTPQTIAALAGCVRIPLSSDDFNDLIGGTGPGAQITRSATATKKFYVPPKGWFVRGVYQDNGAGPFTSPGAGSVLILSLLATTIPTC